MAYTVDRTYGSPDRATVIGDGGQFTITMPSLSSGDLVWILVTTRFGYPTLSGAGHFSTIQSWGKDYGGDDYATHRLFYKTYTSGANTVDCFVSDDSYYGGYASWVAYRARPAANALTAFSYRHNQGADGQTIIGHSTPSNVSGYDLSHDLVLVGAALGNGGGVAPYLFGYSAPQIGPYYSNTVTTTSSNVVRAYAAHRSVTTYALEPFNSGWSVAWEDSGASGILTGYSTRIYLYELIKVPLDGDGRAAASATANLGIRQPVAADGRVSAQPTGAELIFKGDLETADGRAAAQPEATLNYTAALTASSAAAAAGSATEVDGASGILYRAIIYNDASLETTFAYPWGNRVLDIDFTDTSNTDIKTGTTQFDEKISATQVDLAYAASSTFFLKSRWVGLPHSGTDYFHFGKSPYKDDSSNPTDLGDTIVVSSLVSDTYDWTITYLDTTTANGTTGAGVTSITWKADDYGGKAITEIDVAPQGAGTATTWIPSRFANNTTVWNDAVATWTLTRAFNTTYYYEYSGTVDLPCIKLGYGKGMADYSGMLFGPKTDITLMAYVRRYWSSGGPTDILNGIDSTGKGVRLYYEDGDVKGSVTDGTTTVTISWDESTATRIGQWNLLVLRRNPATGNFELLVNGTEEDSDTDSIRDSIFARPHPTTVEMGEASYAKTFEMYFANVYQKSISDEEVDAILLDLS